MDPGQHGRNRLLIPNPLVLYTSGASVGAEYGSLLWELPRTNPVRVCVNIDVNNRQMPVRSKSRSGSNLSV